MIRPGDILEVELSHFSAEMAAYRLIVEAVYSCEGRASIGFRATTEGDKSSDRHSWHNIVPGCRNRWIETCPSRESFWFRRYRIVRRSAQLDLFGEVGA